MAQSKENATASLVAIHTHTDGRADVIVTGTYGQLTLNISADGPCIGIRDPDRGELRYKAVAALKANGRLTGWFVTHKGATPSEDTMVFFPKEEHHKHPVLTAKKVKK